MMNSALTSSHDNNSSLVSSLGVIQTVKKWFRNSWPFATKDESSETSASKNAEHDEEEEVLAYIHDDECASVDDRSCIVESGDGWGVVGQASHYGERQSDEENEASSEEQKGKRSNDCHYDKKPGSKVLGLVLASPKKYFLRNRQRKSCRFGLDEDNDKIDEANDDDDRMIASRFGGLHNDAADNKVSSTTSTASNINDGSNKVKNIVLGAYVGKTLPQDTTATPHNWTKEGITSLRKAYQQSNPTSTTLWHDISTAMKEEQHDYSASECQKMWFALVATPKKRVAPTRRRKNGGGQEVVISAVDNLHGEEEEEEEDDLFDSTPLKHAVQEIENELDFLHHCGTAKNAAATTRITKQQRRPLREQTNTFQSPNKSMSKMIKSPLPKRPRMFSPKNAFKSRKDDTILSPVINRRKGYSTYVNNLRKEIDRAQKLKSRKGVGSCGYGSDVKCSNMSGATSKRSIRIKEVEGKSQLCAELAPNGMFALNIHEEISSDGSGVDVFEEAFRMEDEEV